MPGLTDTSLSEAEAARLLAPLADFSHVALAVSGGPDSVALMALAARWARAGAGADRPDITVLTVDHALRPEAAKEARVVCKQAAALGLPCHVLRWQGEKPATGVQAAARRARYDLLGGWCAEHGAALVVAHQLEDQAETVLMRLARGSGVDGLAGMAERGVLEAHPVAVLRPLLSVPRARLAATARAAGLTWVNDPSNQNAAYERVRTRALLKHVSAHGLEAPALARTARRAGRARAALESWTEDLLNRHLICHEEGWGEMPLSPLLALPEDIRLRVLAAMAEMFGAGAARYRLAALERLEDWLVNEESRARVLGGGRFQRRKRTLVAGREPGRLAAAGQLTPQRPRIVWDNRFTVSASGFTGELDVLALGSLRGADLPQRPKELPAFVWRALPVLCAKNKALAIPSIGWKAKEAREMKAEALFTGCARSQRSGFSA